jgi:ATP/maltotriose-dependent transcriptional regulator MalT
MTESEAAAVLGPEPSAVHFSEQAEGWPAVIGLAAAVESAELPADAVPQALHHYLAEELFQQASPPLQAGLLNLALRRGSHLEAALGRDAEAILVEAERLGFNAGETTFELHPLLREFLLEKVVVLPDAGERVRQAVAEHVGNGAWDHALALLVRFGLVDLVDETLTDAFKPLARNGRLATLAAFARTLQGSLKSNASAIKVVLAEAAFADGHFDLALDLADAVRPQLGRDHPLASRVAAVRGQVAFLQADFRAAEIAFRDARDVSTDDRDEAEANYGLALASIFGEQAGAATVVEALRTSRNRSPIDYLRFVSAEIALRLVGGTHEGLGGNLHLDSAREMLPHAADPRVRTNLAYTIASALALRGEYQNARDWLGKFFKDAEEFGLEFAMPYANWTLAQVAIGQRRFGEAERALQAVEDTAAQRREYHHSLNANVLRARLLLQTGKTASAVSCVTPNPGVPLIPSWEGEYLATRALALACAGDDRGSAEAAVAAESRSGALEVRGLVLAARAVKGIEDLSRARRDVSALVEFGRLLDAWDPVVCAIRASPRLAEAIGEQQELRPTLEALCQRTGDAAMARRAGFRTRATSTPSELLSPREYEVLGLIARGYKNRDISRALFIADSTTKVHVRHILEKLGVRTRAEAAARLRMFEGG